MSDLLSAPALRLGGAHLGGAHLGGCTPSASPSASPLPPRCGMRCAHVHARRTHAHGAAHGVYSAVPQWCRAAPAGRPSCMPPALALAAEGTLSTLLRLGTKRLTSASGSANSSTRPRISICAMRCRVGVQDAVPRMCGIPCPSVRHTVSCGMPFIARPHPSAPLHDLRCYGSICLCGWWLCAARGILRGGGAASMQRAALRVQKVDRIDQKTSDDPYEEYGHGGHVAADMDISTRRPLRALAAGQNAADGRAR